MGKYIDHGSMAYLLSTPIGRRKIVMTQYLVLLTAMLIVVMYTFVLIVLLLIKCLFKLVILNPEIIDAENSFSLNLSNN